jgi:hypothetical protein
VFGLEYLHICDGGGGVQGYSVQRGAYIFLIVSFRHTMKFSFILFRMEVLCWKVL